MIKYYFIKDRFSNAGVNYNDASIRDITSLHGQESKDCEIFIREATTVKQIGIPVNCFTNVMNALKVTTTRNSLNNPDKIYISKNIAFPRRKLKYFPKDINLEIAKSIKTADTVIVDIKSYKEFTDSFMRYIDVSYVVKYGDVEDPSIKCIVLPCDITTSKQCYHLDRTSALDNNTKIGVNRLLEKDYPTWISLDLCVFNRYQVNSTYKDLFEAASCGKPLVDKSVLMTSIGSGAMDYEAFTTVSGMLKRFNDMRDTDQINIVLDSISSYNRIESRFYLSWLYHTQLRDLSVLLNTNNKSLIKHLEDDNLKIFNESRYNSFEAIMKYMKRSISANEDFKVPMSLIVGQIKGSGQDLITGINELKMLGDFKINFTIKEEIKNYIDFDVAIPADFHEYF